MLPSLSNPVYTVKIVTAKKTYTITPIVLELSVSQAKKTMATKVTMQLYNKDNFRNDIDVDDKVYIYANTGDGAVEMFRGPIWTISRIDKASKEFKIIAYDNLIYLQESEDSFYFSKGKSTNNIMSEICKKWGISITYSYDSISHEDTMFYKKNVADIILELLEEVRKQKSSKYTIYSKKGKMAISKVGTNTTIYHLKKSENVISTSDSVTKEGMVTKVIVLGSKEDKQSQPVLATVTGDTSKYGTLQRIITKNGDTELSKSETEANEILKEKGTPQKTYELTAIDNPWVERGHYVKIATDDINGTFLVLSVDHDGVSKTMDLEVEPK